MVGLGQPPNAGDFVARRPKQATCVRCGRYIAGEPNKACSRMASAAACATRAKPHVPRAAPHAGRPTSSGPRARARARPRSIRGQQRVPTRKTRRLSSGPGHGDARQEALRAGTEGTSQCGGPHASIRVEYRAVAGRRGQPSRSGREATALRGEPRRVCGGRCGERPPPRLWHRLTSGRRDAQAVGFSSERDAHSACRAARRSANMNVARARARPLDPAQVLTSRGCVADLRPDRGGRPGLTRALGSTSLPRRHPAGACPRRSVRARGLFPSW